MNPIEKTVWKILLNNVILDDTIIPVLVNSPPTKEYTPCITLKSSDLGYKGKRYMDTFFYPVTSDNPLYDKDNPDTKYPFEVQLQKQAIEVQANVWCNTEEERTRINEQIETLLNEVQNFNYKFCQQYQAEDKTCKTLNSKCTAITSTNGRANKNQCPNPTLNKYKNILTENLIIPHSIIIEPAFNIDELNDDPITLHSVFKINMDYYKQFFVGGNPNTIIQLN